MFLFSSWLIQCHQVIYGNPIALCMYKMSKHLSQRQIGFITVIFCSEGGSKGRSQWFPLVMSKDLLLKAPWGHREAGSVHY